MNNLSRLELEGIELEHFNKKKKRSRKIPLRTFTWKIPQDVCGMSAPE